MKVCHVITRMIIGGAQENTLLSAKGLAEAGEQSVLLTGPTDGPEGKLLETFGIPAGVTVELCPSLVRNISPVKDLKAYFFLRNYFRENKFDVVHTHSSKAGIIGRLAAHAADVPVIVHTIHGPAFHSHEKWWKNKIFIFLESLCAKVSHKIFAVAQAMIDQSLAAGIGKPEQYQVVYSGMELEKFLNAKRETDLRKQLNIPESAKVVGTVARLFPLKGYEELMKIIPGLLEREKDLYFLFVGNGTMMPEIRQWAEQGGFGERIVFAGLIPPDEVCRYIAQMDLLVHFSLREGLPRAAVQALAEAKPVVAYPLDGTPEVVLDGITGQLCPVGDTDAMTDAIANFLADEEKRKSCGKAGQDLVKGKFHWQTMSNTLLAAYKDLLEQKNV